MALITDRNAERELAVARAEFDAARQGLSRVMDDMLIADLRGSIGAVAAANNAAALHAVVNDTAALLELMRSSLEVIDGFETRTGQSNKSLHINPRVTFDAVLEVNSRLGVVDGRVEKVPSLYASLNRRAAKASRANSSSRGFGKAAR